MATEAQVAANRENAKKSTGPKSKEGKARSARNALKHGLRARVILDYVKSAEHEQPKPFADLLTDLVAELAPAGVMEEYCVETIAVTMWRLRRVIAEELNLLDELHVDAEDSRWLDDLDRQPGDPDPGPLIYAALPPAEKLQPLTRYEAHLDRQKERAYKQLRELQAARLVPNSGDNPGDSSSYDEKLPNQPNPEREPNRGPSYIPKHPRYDFGNPSGYQPEKHPLTPGNRPVSPDAQGPALQASRPTVSDQYYLARTAAGNSEPPAFHMLAPERDTVGVRSADNADPFLSSEPNCPVTYLGTRRVQNPCWPPRGSSVFGIPPERFFASPPSPNPACSLRMTDWRFPATTTPALGGTSAALQARQ